MSIFQANRSILDGEVIPVRKMNSIYRTGFKIATLGSLCLATACSSHPTKSAEEELTEAVPTSVDPIATTDTVPVEPVVAAAAADTKGGATPETVAVTDPVASAAVAGADSAPTMTPDAPAAAAATEAKPDSSASALTTTDPAAAVSAPIAAADANRAGKSEASAPTETAEKPKNRKHKRVAKHSAPRSESTPESVAAPVQEQVIAESPQPMTPAPVEAVPPPAMAQQAQPMSPPPAPVNPEPARIVPPPAQIHAANDKAGVVETEEPAPLHKNPWVLGGAVVLLLAGGFVAFRPRSGGY